jgi:ribosome maturation factor RimP
MLSTQVEQLVGECVVRHGAHVIDVVIRGQQHRTMMEVYVDAESGVSTELCAAISREISAALKMRPLLDTMYQLTVSSPGIDRPLCFPWQYRKHVGRDLTVRVTAGDGNEEHTGRLAAVDEQGLVLEEGKAGEQCRIPFETIVRAIVKAPW